jgi:hypothetical protein
MLLAHGDVWVGRMLLAHGDVWVGRMLLAHGDAILWMQWGKYLHIYIN